MMIENLSLTYGKLKAFTTHVLDQDGEVQLAAATNFKAIRILCLLNTERYVRIQLAEQTLAKMAAGDIFSFLTGERRVIYHEMHGNGGLTDLLERDGYDIFRRAKGISDVNVSDAGDCYDGTNVSLLHLNLVQTVEFIELTNLYLDLFVRFMVVTNDNFLIHLNGTIIYLTNADASDIFIVVNGADQYLRTCLGISFGSGNVVQNSLKQRLHVGARSSGLQRGNASLRRSKNEGAIQLRIICIQFKEEL